MQISQVYEGLANFFDGYFLAILIATGLLFLMMFVTWTVYKTLSKRNIFNLHQKHGGMTYATKGDWFVYILKYFFLFPLYTFFGFLIFAFSLFMLMKPQTANEEVILLFVAIVMVSAIRVSAYVNEQLAEDFAKLIPLTMLSVILINPSLDKIGITWGQIDGFFTLIPSFLKYLVFTIILEAVLRGGTWLMRNFSKSEDEGDSPAE